MKTQPPIFPAIRSQREVAEILGLSTNYVQQVEYSALRKLRRALGAYEQVEEGCRYSETTPS